MKITAIAASERKNENSELAAKYTAKKLNAEFEILKLTKATKARIEPCKAYNNIS